MPLAFESMSHGTIAFGFFNIESDMLLCDRYFFFAEDFCRNLADMADRGGDHVYQASWPVWLIEAADDIGDLMGAIHGVRYTGFIGELYRQYPFPRQPEEFKQNPAGSRTRDSVRRIISRYGLQIEIPVAVDPEQSETAIGPYHFNRRQFQELLKYVWRGGYPRWKDEIRPNYVHDMNRKILSNPVGVFQLIEFGD
jgi:hypothetical protein